MVLDLKLYPIEHDYVITSEDLGSGVNGSVRKITHRATGKDYALKVLKFTERSIKEISIQYHFRDCPHIVRIEDVYQDLSAGGDLYVVMEYMAGGELFNRIIRHRQSGFTERDAASIVFQIASAIQHLHQNGIAHRDIKPENLLYESDSPDAILKLADFGFAKEGADVKSLRSPLYTAYYAAPEVLGSTYYDRQCDLWSLGVITFILLFGCPPFYSATNRSYITDGMRWRIKNGCYDIPSGFDHISKEGLDFIKRLLKVRPSERLTIEGVMQHPWIVGHANVPQTPLPEINNLEPTYEEAFAVEKTHPMLKELNNADNDLLRRRQLAAIAAASRETSESVTIVGPATPKMSKLDATAHPSTTSSVSDSPVSLVLANQ